MPPLLNLLYRLGLVLVWPTPTNFRALFAVVNGLLASFGLGEARAFTPSDWEALRKLREADAKKGEAAARKRKARAPKRR